MSKKLILGIVMLIGLVVGMFGTSTTVLAAREPLSSHFFFQVWDGILSGTQNFYKVPAGKQLVIEFVSMLCTVPSSQRVHMEVHTDRGIFRLVNTYQGLLGALPTIRRPNWCGSMPPGRTCYRCVASAAAALAP
jgi:hypothetical protein